ncbi:MAG: tetratricopeptide repeat protein, partial [Gemmatimonadetes bacterium]|nr:tetratricopeptide repeat protein [Gemmatimonadota bacterium]
MTLRLRNLPLGDRYRRAAMHYRRGMYSLARQELESVLDSASELASEEEAEIRWQLANCCAALGQSDEADRIVDAATELEGLSETTLSRLEAVRGFSALSRGDYA